MGLSIAIADTRIVRQGLRRLLEQRDDLDVVGEACSGDEALDVVAMQRPDLLLLELALAGRNGIEVIRGVPERSPRTRCLVLSAFAGSRRVRMALDAGARGYLLKTASEEDLLDAIDTVAADRVHLSPEIARHAIEELTRGAGEPADPLSRLTRRELEVMRLVCCGESTKGVAKCLGLSVKTADSHRYAMMRKLGLRKVPDLVRLAVREGVIEP